MNNHSSLNVAQLQEHFDAYSIIAVTPQLKTGSFHVRIHTLSFTTENTEDTENLLPL